MNSLFTVAIIRGTESTLTFIQILCLYGYSKTCYLIVAIISIIPY